MTKKKAELPPLNHKGVIDAVAVIKGTREEICSPSCNRVRNFPESTPYFSIPGFMSAFGDSDFTKKIMLWDL